MKLNLRSPETCARISAALTGKPKSPEHVAALRAARAINAAKNDQTATVTYCPICEVIVDDTTTRHGVMFGPDVLLATHLQETHGRTLKRQELGNQPQPPAQLGES